MTKHALLRTYAQELAEKAAAEPDKPYKEPKN
jgi:hypothetical protein